VIDLRQFEPLPSTTEGLSALMLDFRIKSASNELHHHPVALEIANRLEEFDDMDPAAKQYCHDMRGMFGAEGLVGILAYQSLREWIQSHQLSSDISGIQIISETVAGQPISYPNWGEQLALLDSDIPLLKAAVPALVDYFEGLAGCLPDYRLVREVWGDGGSSNPDWVPSTISEVRTFSGMAGMAWIHTESWDWRPNDQGQIMGHYVDRDPPDQIHLIFRLGRPDSEDSINFVLLNPDL
jgi:hypothetical protein